MTTKRIAVPGSSDFIQLIPYNTVGAPIHFENLSRCSASGETIWIAQLPTHSEKPDAYMNAQIEGERVMARSWSWYRVELNVASGAIEKSASINLYVHGVFVPMTSEEALSRLSNEPSDFQALESLYTHNRTVIEAANEKWFGRTAVVRSSIRYLLGRIAARAATFAPERQTPEAFIAELADEECKRLHEEPCFQLSASDAAEPEDVTLSHPQSRQLGKTSESNS